MRNRVIKLIRAIIKKAESNFMIDIIQAKNDPAKTFKSPHDVIDDKSISRLDKIDILHRWAYDEREMAVAEEENMLATTAEGKKNVLDEILRCLLELGVENDKDRPPTKQG